MQYVSIPMRTYPLSHLCVQLEAELQECRVEVQGLRVALSHLQKENKSHIQEKVRLHLGVNR